MSKSICFERFGVGAAVLFTGLLTTSLFAQTQASCSFTTFDPPSGYIYGFYPNGINHYNTIVGGVFGPSQGTEKAFVRYSGGSITLFGVPNAHWTLLTRRNLNGTSVGSYGSAISSLPPGTGSNGLIYTPSSWATLNYPGSPSTALAGINKWNTIIGYALDASTNGTFGFKYQHGTFTKIQYPGAFATTVTGINDNGVIVGAYQMGNSGNPWSGYMLKNGVFTKLSYVPVDINNNGTIVEGNSIHFPDGTVKGVYLSGSANTFIGGINDAGVITGGASWGTFEFKGFTATCH